MSCLKPRPRILAVDDDNGVLESLGLILEERYDVLEARNGDTALKLIQSEPVDLVLLDVLIEGIDGITLLQQLRARGNDVPVIIVSGLDNSWTAAAAMRLGAVDYVTKPFEETELLRMIESTLRHHGAAAELRQAPRAPRVLLIGFPVGLAAALTVAVSSHASVESIPAGGDALALIPSVSPDILVLDVTSVPNPNEILGAVTGAHLVLQKPVSLRGLLKAITAELRPSVSLLPLFTPKVVDVMESVSVHFAAVTVHDLSRDLGKSPDYLSRLFYAETGMTLKAYLNRVQVEAARQLLLKTGDKIEAVAGQVGFHDASHLSRSFVKYLGQRPGDFHKTASEGPTRPRASSPPPS
jgi:DNA-binding response OmpR family regulator